MKALPLIIGIFSFSLYLSGQDKSNNFDTLIVNIHDEIIIKTAVYECAWLKDIDSYPEIINEFKSKIKTIKHDIPIDMSYILIYTQNKDLVIEPKADRVYYNLNNGISKHRKNECIIQSDYFDIFIEFNNLDTFLDLNIIDCINQARIHECCNNVGDFATKDHHGIAWKMTYKCENDSISFIPEESHWTGHKSMLELVPSIGAGVIQNDIATDFSFRIGRLGTHKGVLKNHQYISYNLIYIFNQDNTLQLNHFINIGFRFNKLNSLNKYKWRGFELGYLINSQGDFFSTPTYRFATMLDLKHNISLTPQIYFDDGFRKIYPGVRIGIGLFNW